MVDLEKEALVVTRLRHFARLLRCVGYTMERQAQCREQHQSMVSLIGDAVLDGYAANPEAAWPHKLARAADLLGVWVDGPEWRPMTAAEYLGLGEWIDQLLGAYSTVLESAA